MEDGYKKPTKQYQLSFLRTLCMGILFFIHANQTFADEKPWSLDLATAFYSDYMFRGLNRYDGVSFQPSVSGSYSFDKYGSLTGGLWMHIPGDGVRKGSKFTQLDQSFFYDVSLGPITFSLGHVWYTYPDGEDSLSDTAELYQAIAFDSILNPKFSAYEDYRTTDTRYFEFSLSQSVETDTFGKGFHFTPFVTFGFSTHGTKVYGDDGLVQVTYGAYTELPLGKLKITPSISSTRKAAEKTVNQLWTGVSLMYGF